MDTVNGRTRAQHQDAFGRDETGGTAVLLLDLALIGLAIAFDPLPLTAFAVVMPSERGCERAPPRARVAGVAGDRGHGHRARSRQ